MIKAIGPQNTNTSKTIISADGPTTQTAEAGRALARFLNMPEELPLKIHLAGSAQLTLSSKKDSYYFTNPKSCSCPAGMHHKICKHVRDLCEALRAAQKAEAT